MEKEFLTQIRRSVTLNVTGGKIDSFREKEETTGTVRAYDNGCIGIAGCLGEPDEQKRRWRWAFPIPAIWRARWKRSTCMRTKSSPCPS